MKKTTLFLLFTFYSLLGFGQTFPEGFEASDSSLPTGWNQLQSGAGTVQFWKISSLVTTPPFICEGLNAAFIDRENLGINNSSQDYLITPSFIVPANGQVRFFSRQGFVGDQGTIYKLKVSVNADFTVLADYIDVKTWTEDQMNTTFNQCQEQKVSLSAYAGQTIFMAFVREVTQTTGAITGDRWLVDKVNVVQECIAPSLGSYDTVTAISANLYWVAPAGQSIFDLEIITNGIPTGVVTNNDVSNNVTITGLTPSTSYQYYVRTDCGAPTEGNVNTSDWIGPFIFQTLALGAVCASPIQVTVLPYQTSNNTGNFNDFVDATQTGTLCGATPAGTNYLQGNDVFYRYTADATGLISIKMTPTSPGASVFVYGSCPVGGTCLAGVANTNSNFRFINNFPVTQNNTYIIVISSGGTTQTTGYTLLIQKENCIPPAGIVPTPQGTETEAVLSWTNPTGATNWEVDIQPAGSPFPSGNGMPVILNPYTATGLTPATQYQYYVRSECAPGIFSSWAGPYIFNTQICSALSETCIYTFRMTDSANNGWNGALMQVRQNGIVLATIGSTYTAANGAGPVDITVPLCINPPFATTFDLFWITAGTQPAQCKVAIINSYGQTLYTKTNGVSGAGQVVYANAVKCDAPVCNIEPINVAVSIITTTGATIAWTAPATDTFGWDIYIVPTGGTTPIASTIPTYDNVTTNPFTTTIPLLADTTYDVYVRVNCTPTDSFWSAIQSFTTLPTCPKPTLISVNGITTTAATFSWTNGSPVNTHWEILLIKNTLSTPVNPPAPPINPVISGTTVIYDVNTPNVSPFTISTLEPATIYYYYIRTVCSNSDNSTWTGPVQFNTITCDAVNKCGYKFVLSNSNGSSWNGARMQVRQNGIVITTIGANSINNANGVTVQLCNNVPFDLFWTIGGTAPDDVAVAIQNPFTDIIFTKPAGINSPGDIIYSLTGNCTPSTCPKPTALTVVSTTQTTATLGWTENALPTPGATQWEIYAVPLNNLTIPPVNGSPVSGVAPYYIVNSNPGTITGLLPSTVYVFYVRSLCSGTDASTWTILNSKNFITKPLNDECVASTVVPVNPTRACVAFASGNTLGASQSLPLSTTGNGCGTTNDDVWFTFIATSNIHIITISNIVGGTLDINHSLYSGNDCSALTQLYCSNPNVSIATNLTAGNVYKIRVYTNGSVVTQTATFDICITTPPPITNDNCADAQPVVVNNGLECISVGSGSLTGATPSTASTTCLGSEDDDVWFSFVATSNIHYLSLINLIGTSTDLNHAVYQGTCGALVQKYCSAAGLLTSDNNTFVINQTYYVRVWSNANTLQDITFDLCIGKALPPITVSTTQYTVQQLVTDVFIDSDCALVSNITYSTGTNFGSTNGIGYFNKSLSEFPLQEGIVLTTGTAANAPGPNLTTLGDGGNGTWTNPDADLEAIVLEATGAAMNSKNVTKLEFDFIPFAPKISFDFIFASEEYGTFQCSYSDSFAFLLTNTVTGVTTNLAVLPGTSTPVSVVTIRDNAHNASCNSVNPEYFASYFGDTGINPIGAPINFNGMTEKLVAAANVTSGTLYHIKLVIADRGDTAYDSSVYINNFQLGKVELGSDFLVANGSAACIGDEITIDSGLSPIDYTFIWLENNVVIDGETGSTLVVDHSGIFTVQALVNNSTCLATDSITVEYFQDALPGEPEDLIICNASGTGNFDLTVNSSLILAPFTVNHVLSYFKSEQNAKDNVNEILDFLNYPNLTNPEIIYVRVFNSVTNCVQVVSFQISVQDLTPQFTFSGNTTVCENASTTITVVPTNNNFDINLVSYVWSLNGSVLVGEISNSLTIQGSVPAGIYSVEVNNTGCKTSQDFTTTVSVLPVATFSFSEAEYCQTGLINPTPILISPAVLGAFTYVADPSLAELSLNPTTGEITLATSDAGDYIITNTIAAANGCAEVKHSVNVRITSAPVADFIYAQTNYCSNGENPFPVFELPARAGEFTSSTGLIINLNTGEINLSTSTVGTYTVTNTIEAAGGCAEVTATFNITITKLPVAEFIYTATAYCKTGINPSPQFINGGVAGDFTSASGLSIDPTTGEINLSGSTAGNYTVTNTIAAALGCLAVVRTFDVTITEPLSAVFSYPSAVYCKETGTANPVFVAPASAGIFSATPAGLVINSTSGAIDLGNSTAGVYTVTNTIGASGGCPGDAKTFTITITQPASGSFFYNTPLCISADTAQTPTSSVTAGGIYSSSPGLVIDTNSGAINSSASAPGNYTVNYDIAASAGCGAFNANFDVVITPASAIKIEEGCDLSFYKLKAIPVLNSFNPLTTTYSWTGTGPIAFEVSPTEPNAIILKSPGTYTVTITTADGCKSEEPLTVTDIGCTIQKGISPGTIDGKNDNFDLTGFNVEKIEIFNRYGTEVFSWGTYTNEWHGQSSGGEDLPDGTYFYVINRKGGITTTGWIYINRQY